MMASIVKNHIDYTVLKFLMRQFWEEWGVVFLSDKWMAWFTNL